MKDKIKNVVELGTPDNPPLLTIKDGQCVVPLSFLDKMFTEVATSITTKEQELFETFIKTGCYRNISMFEEPTNTESTKKTFFVFRENYIEVFELTIGFIWPDLYQPSTKPKQFQIYHDLKEARI